ncbi:MAG: UPF0179 family protein [Promethearchaeota archaeon]
MTKDGIITLVGKSFAEKGYKFFFNKPREDICPSSCKFFNPCMNNLKPGTIYQIIENLGIEHTCPSDYHEESMILVKVQESKIEILLECKNIFLGAVIKYKPFKCEHEDCPYRKYCVPIRGLIPGNKIKIIKVIKKVKKNMCTDRRLSIVMVEKVQ